MGEGPEFKTIARATGTVAVGAHSILLPVLTDSPLKSGSILLSFYICLPPEGENHVI